MIRRYLLIACVLLPATLSNGVESPAWSVHVLPSERGDPTPLLLQADGDAAPEWGILLDNQVRIAEIAPEFPVRTIALPAGTALFDLRDTDRDGTAELAVVRADRLEYWPDASSAHETDPAFSITDEGIAALSIGGPRPYTLFLEDRGEDFITVPIRDISPIWTLDGTPVSSDLLTPARPLVHTQYHAWSTPAGTGDHSSSAMQISQRYERRSEQTDSPSKSSPAPRSGGTRRARDAGDAPHEEWPWFTLSGGSRVLYALAPPDFRDTLIRVDRRDAPRAPASPVPNPRRYPGTVIAPGESGSDFNGDGFNDLLLWRAPRPGASLDVLVQAAQDGDWDVELSVHLFDPASGRFAARPIDWVHTKAPIEGVLAGGVHGPFQYLSLEDLDGDGRADLLCSGASREMSAWKFFGRLESTPWARVTLRDPIEGITLTARIPGYYWLGIARSAQAFQLLALPKR